VTTYVYDVLNRVTKRTYSDSTPEVDYYYDGQPLPSSAPSFTRGSSTGRLVAVCYGGTTASAGNYTGYDPLGRPNASVQQTEGLNYAFNYGYNLAGQMTSETYPSGRTITNGYDGDGRLRSVNGQKTGEASKTYASTFSYTAHDAVASMQLGNGKWEHTTFNSRLQPTQIGLGSLSTNSSLLQLDYAYNTTGLANNNGNVLTQTITLGATVMSQSYNYDSLNRLTSATETGAWTQTYDYDRFGNRAVRNTSYIPQPQLTPQSAFAGDVSAFNASNNRVVSSQYDATGNQTVDGQNRTFTFDAENRQTTFNVTSGQYFYDGDGHRVKKLDNSGTTVFVYNAGGQLIAEYHSDPAPPPAGGGGTSYLTSDHLGSTRVVTKQDGSVKARYDYLPFGEELGAGVGSRTTALGYSAADGTKQKFTQKERDSESGFDYFLARYYSSAQGRFTSVDPGPPNLSDPQIWNRYSYCGNDPLNYVDPDGLYRWGTTLGGSLTDNQLRERLKNAKSLGEAFKTATIIFQRNAIRHSLAEIEKAQKYYGAETTNGRKLGAVREAYGQEGRGGPVVGVDPQIRGGGETRNGAVVIFRPETLALKGSGGQLWTAQTVAHEGQHIVNFNNGVRSGFEDEIRAFETSSIMVQTRLDLAPWIVFGPREDHLFFLDWLSDPKTLSARRRQTIIDHLKHDPLYQDIGPKAKGRRKE
jgi:RHS repeat-associated protein